MITYPIDSVGYKRINSFSCFHPGAKATWLSTASILVGAHGVRSRKLIFVIYLKIAMILEAVILKIKPNLDNEFEMAFQKASAIIASMDGYLSHELHRCMEVKGKYLLLVRWDTLEAHTIGFRSSSQYQRWKQLLHHFYDPFPIVEHFEAVEIN